LNNTFYDNNTTNTSFNAELLVEYTENCTIKNNIFSAQNTEKLLTIVRDTPGGASSTGLTLDYNLYHHPNGTAAVVTQYEGQMWTGFANYQTDSGKETNSIFATADFMDAGAQNFDIASTSAAINSGDPTFTTAVGETDFVGNTRLVNARVDMGAFESQMVLPVEFVDFAGRQVDDFIQLKWMTEAEINHSHFEIERGIVGQNFEKIGKIVRSNDADNYYFSDKKPTAGLNYYRLRQVDLDGAHAYSLTVAIDFFTKNIQIFPNPVTDVLEIWQEEDELHYFLFHVNGQEIQRGVFKQNDALDLSDLEIGIYFLKMENGGEVEIRKVVKRDF
jgi:hypothetical protein